MDYLVNLNLNKNELQNAVIQPLATAPSNGTLGQIYYNSTNHLMYQHNGTAWAAVGSLQDVQNAAGTSFVTNGIATIPNASTSAAGLMTTTQVTKLNGIAEGAQVNVIETVKVNGTVLTPSSKAVDITAIPLSIVTGADDLKAIEALTGTSGLLKKTAANTWALDTTTYLSSHQTITLASGTNNGTLKITTAAGTTDNIAVKGLSNAAYKDVDTSISSGSTSTKLPTTAAVASYVDSAIEGLPEPMIFKGSVGTGGTVTWANLPAAATSNEGHTYKVITAHTAETGKPAAEVGDTIISTGSEWVVIPSGDEPKGTVTSVAISNGGLISVSGSPITSSGTITLTHGTPTGASSIGTAGFYKIKTDAYGHVNGTTAVAKADITGLLGDYVTSVNGSTGAVTISNATQSSAGLMSAADKVTLDNLEAASQGAITYTTLTIAQGQTSISASGVASKLITFQAYQGGEAVVVDYDGSAFSVAAAASSAITIKCVTTV